MQARESSGETLGTTAPELRELLLQAREINRANGHLIGGALHYVQDALGVLRGHSAVTYDSRGHTGASCNERVPLGRA
jgi:flagellar biosynthesis/type III secretory pathway chaperone